MDEAVQNFDERVLAFELQSGGSHPSYIRNFADLWKQFEIPAAIKFIVTQEFLARHKDVCDFVNNVSPGQVSIQTLTAEENALVAKESFAKEFHGWKLCCKYARDFEATRSILMYSDRFQLPMLVGERSPCPVSCIYFRPTFHYAGFNNFRPNLKHRIAAARKAWMLKRLLKLKQMDVLFCLDPLAAEYIRQNMTTSARIRVLPDSFVRPETPEDELVALRNELGIEPNRRVLLLLGILDSRKGPGQLLQAAIRLSKEDQQRLCLLMIGKIEDSIEAETKGLIRTLEGPGHAQVIFNNAYVSDTIVQRYYDVADVALTTYQRHMGMSSALIRAALAGIPVLSSDYGLMGEMVLRHKLGQVTNTESQAEFSASLSRVIANGSSELFDAAAALDWTTQHSPEALGATLKEWVAG